MLLRTVASRVSRLRCRWERLFHSYRHALVREIDPSLPEQALCQDSDKRSKIDLTLAKHQHDSLINAINSCNGIEEVFSLPSDGFADSVFIEDTAVIIEKRVLIARPGAPSRLAETRRIKDSFKKYFGDIELAEVEEGGTLDGGDVLFTGSEIIVGESLRTNRIGIRSLQRAFPTLPVYPVSLDQLTKSSADESSKLAPSLAPVTPLHLKSFCSVYGPNNQIVVGGALGNAFAHWLEHRSIEDSDDDEFLLLRKHALHSARRQSYSFPAYQVLRVPDADAANCIFVNGSLIRRSAKEFPQSAAIFDKEVKVPQHEVNCSELAKVDGAISCCVLLF